MQRSTNTVSIFEQAKQTVTFLGQKCNEYSKNCPGCGVGRIGMGVEEDLE